MKQFTQNAGGLGIGEEFSQDNGQSWYVVTDVELRGNKSNRCLVQALTLDHTVVRSFVLRHGQSVIVREY